MPIVNRAVIGAERSASVPPSASVVNPSNAHAFGVMRLISWIEAGI